MLDVPRRRPASEPPGRSSWLPETSARLELIVGDLTTERTDVIVNPSNRDLSGGGLVDLAVRRAAGPELGRACRAAMRELQGRLLSPGEVRLTQGYALPARYVIHCVPETYEPGSDAPREHLAACYGESLRLCRIRAFASVSFPAIGIGAYGFPIHEAARLATAEVVEQLAAHGEPGLVRFVLYGPAMLEAYAEAARLALRNLA